VTPILEVQNLFVSYATPRGALHAVDNVSFTLHEGETLALVGESGCGKSTAGRAILNILGNANVGGQVHYRHASGLVDLLKLSRRAIRPYRADLQMIFQDPYSSLNPRMTVLQMIEEPLKIHTRDTAAQRRQRVMDLLEKVGLSAEHALRYPHEFSGGQRQRIGIARALATRPRIVIADEPVSALDVSIQAQIVNLLQDLQAEFGLSMIFIAHDLSLVRHIATTIAVMYLGHLVEVGPAEVVLRDPLHPYTRALLSAVPRPDPDARGERRIRLSGEVPSAVERPSGCVFRTRCPVARPECSAVVPPLVEKAERNVACPWT